MAQKTDALVEASLSENTRTAYGKAGRAWSDLCLGFGLDPTGGAASGGAATCADPAAAADERWLVMHLTALAESHSLSTILLRRAAVVSIHKRLKWPLALDDAEFEAFLKGLRRTRGRPAGAQGGAARAQAARRVPGADPRRAPQSWLAPG